MIKEKLGIVMVAVGMSTAGADNNPLVPIAFMAAGLWLMRGLVEW